MTILDFVSTVYPAVQIDCGQSALEQVVCAVRQINRQHGRNVRICEVSEDLISSHIRWLKDKGLAADTLHRRLVHLQTIWRIAYRKKLTRHKFFESQLPTIKRPKHKPIAWSTADVRKMLQVAENVNDPLFGPKHWKALLQLIYFTGLRIGAVLSLRRSDLHGHILLVPFGMQKDKEDQSFRLTNDLVNMLISLPRPVAKRGEKDLFDLLIPFPYYAKNIQRIFAKRILIPAGLPIDGKHKFHAMRKTVATYIAATEGKEAALRVMGHSSISVLERYLADPGTVDPSLKSDFSPIDVMPRLIG